MMPETLILEYRDVQNRLFTCLEVGNYLSRYNVAFSVSVLVLFSALTIFGLSVKCMLWWCSFD